MKRNTSAALGSVSFPFKGYMYQYLWAVFRHWPPIRWKKLAVCCSQACRPRTSGTRRLGMLTPIYLSTNPSEQCPWADHTLSELFLWNSSLPPAGSDTQFWRHYLLWPPWPCKAIKLLFSTSSLQNSVSEFNLERGWESTETKFWLCNHKPERTIKHLKSDYSKEML